MRAVGPAVKRGSSSLLTHAASAAASATGAAGSMGAGITAGAARPAGAGDHRRTRLLNVAMRSKAAAAAVEGSNYEDEVGRSAGGCLMFHACCFGASLFSLGGAHTTFCPRKKVA